jgi:hypothetical protein
MWPWGSEQSLAVERMEEGRMKDQRVMIGLTVINFGIMIVMLFHQSRTVEASAPASMLRARGLEIVDEQGRVRASIKIAPAGPARAADGRVSNDGKVYPETVLLRLIRPDGRPTVKIATSEEGSGVSLGGGVDPAYVVLDAQGGDPSLSLTNKNGERQLIKP